MKEMVYYSHSALRRKVSSPPGFRHGAKTERQEVKRVRFDPMRPIWLQVKGAIETSIVSGERAPGEKLPGGRELAVTYGINPNTAARVYQELERDGLCETRRGTGTFVTGDAGRIAALRKELAHLAVSEFTQKVEALGVSREEAAQMILSER